MDWTALAAEGTTSGAGGGAIVIALIVWLCVVSGKKGPKK